MEQTSEESLKNALREGSTEAYKTLYTSHYGVLCTFAAKLVKDDFLAETIVSDVIFHLWEIKDTLFIEGSLRQYLMRSVRNRCINYLNSSYHRNEGGIETKGISDLPVAQYLKNDDYPLGRLLEKELENIIEGAIEKLPDQCRKVFCMNRFDGKTYQEIAEEMSISVNTVKYHMKNALTQLRSDLGRYLVSMFIAYISGGQG